MLPTIRYCTDLISFICIIKKSVEILFKENVSCSIQETRVSETCIGQKLLTGLRTIQVLDRLRIMRFQNLFGFESLQFYMLKADIFHKATIQSDNFLLGS